MLEKKYWVVRRPEFKKIFNHISYSDLSFRFTQPSCTSWAPCSCITLHQHHSWEILSVFYKQPRGIKIIAHVLRCHTSYRFVNKNFIVSRAQSPGFCLRESGFSNCKTFQWSCVILILTTLRTTKQCYQPWCLNDHYSEKSSFLPHDLNLCTQP